MKGAVEFVAWLLMITSGLAAAWAVLEFLISLAGVIDARFWLPVGISCVSAVLSIVLFAIEESANSIVRDEMRGREAR